MERGNLSRVELSSRPEAIDSHWQGLIKSEFEEFKDLASAEELEGLVSDGLQFAEKLRSSLLSAASYVDEDELSSRLVPVGVKIGPLEFDQLREKGAFIAVPDHGDWLYPEFQFSDAFGSVHSSVQDIQSELLNNFGPWGSLNWWLSEHPRLGLAPSDLLINESPKLRTVLEQTLGHC